MSNIRILICTRGNSDYLHNLVTSLQYQLDVYPDKVRIGIASNRNDPGPLDNRVDVALSAPVGYASTRQEALKLRMPGEGVIFLDDDNIVPSDWLSQLLKTIERYPSHIVKGRVNYIDENYVRIPNLTDGLRGGKELHFAGMSNLFFPSYVVDSQDFVFNPDFNFGGEDTELTFKLWKKGCKILVSDGFPVFEVVSINKKSPNYLSERLRDSKVNFDKVISLHGNSLDKLKRLIPQSVKALISRYYCKSL